MNKQLIIRFWTMLVMGISLVHSNAQDSHQYEVTLEPMTIDGLGGLQSYSVASYGGEWLVIGGRLDGLHRRQPFAAFDATGRNTDLIVVDPSTSSVWKASVNGLPSRLKEPLSSTNMQFVTVDSFMVLTGGYGYSPTKGDHITYPNLTIVNIPQLIRQVKEGKLDESAFVQFEDEYFRVTGGRMERIGEEYFLVGGQRFMGRYNPMGPTHGPGFEQEYTNEVRKFKIDFTNATWDKSGTIHDERHLHKRDYNLAKGIKDNAPYLMAYSGVFQPTADLPWLYPVMIDSDGYKAMEEFQQYFNHYHCANVAIYEPSSKTNHTIFFGGIAQFYMDGDVLVQDNDVPFVTSIADVTRYADGTMKELLMSTSMPDYLGAGSEFIPIEGPQFYAEGILDGDKIGTDELHIGYIYGGIKSDRANIFWQNEGDLSEAHHTIFKVNISRQTTSATQNAIVSKDLLIYPNPAQDVVRMVVDLEQSADLVINVFDINGREVASQRFQKDALTSGKNYLTLAKAGISYGTYLYKITINGQSTYRKVSWTE